MSFIIGKSKKLIFVNKNCPSDLKVSCKLSSNLMQLIENNLSLEEEFESLFEQDQVMDM